MPKLLIASVLTLLLCACGRSQQAAPEQPASAGSAATAASSWINDSPDEVTPPRSAAQLSAQMLQQVLQAPGRSAAARKLDAVRHPAKTLAFFGLQPDMNVIQVEPADAWYAAILAPLLKANGTYTAALVSPLANAHAAAATSALRKAFDADPARFDRARITSFDPHTPNLGTPGSVDMVLSFGNLHHWIGNGKAKIMLKAMFEVLRPGGVLGLVDNRAEIDSDPADLKGTPYVSQQHVIELARQAGFTLDAASNLNANPADTRSADTAPADADRMTLRLVKPSKPAHAASA